VVAYAAANVAHEGVGHGGACLAVGGRAVMLNAVFFECDKEGIVPSAGKIVSASGTLVNLALAAISALALRGVARRPGPPGPLRHFLWLFLSLNLLQATGYWLFSGLGNVGDWAKVVEGWSPAWIWRALLTLVGAAGYWAAVLVALRALGPLLGSGPDRLRRAVTLTVVPYVTGGILYVAAGLLNPYGVALVLVSAVAASFGGASALAWMAQLLRNARRWPPGAEEVPPLARSPAWIAAGLATALAFVLVLGPGVGW
jgi:hypothetical protein